MSELGEELKAIYGDLITPEALESLRRMKQPRKGEIRTVKVVDVPLFSGRVFGADCFIANFPEITTTGIRVQKQWGYGHKSWYVIDEHGNRYHDTSFFSEKEMVFLARVDTPAQQES